ncbi:methylaspartate mutase accessory protein GlmL [Azospirillum sp. ST 5-10]|uniref:methylaspartate mutase accessory protein GlmL n=1 Tax=unclassified Azospirillum TaxID=2630922 RepID=UPI003F4A66B3
MSHALLVDFGSTYTKLRAVDLAAGRIVGSGQGPSTVTTDITVGLGAALADLERRLGGLPRFEHRLATSSAAGGLRMATVGLVRELTAEAARLAALGAGAKLVGTFAYSLTAGDVADLEALAPDILLLAGGTDGGNRAVILENAAALARSALDCPIVVAGNRVVADAVRDTLAGGGKSVLVAGNVMPEFGRLDLEPARAAIRRVFIERIVHAKGMDRAQGMLDAVLMPTPAAVLEGARLLAEGLPGRPGLGPLLVVDIGGATTDVHSVCSGEPSRSGVLVQGLPEPHLKRTVEGDLGMRHNAASIADAVGLERLAADAGLAPERARSLLALVTADVERVPDGPEEAAFDRALARAAIALAVGRHAGTVETVYAVTGPVTVQRGKDLTQVGTIIGTGGVLVHGADPAGVLRTALADPANPLSLRPLSPRLMLDRHYLLYACGLLQGVAPEAALALGLRHLDPLDEDDHARHRYAS